MKKFASNENVSTKKALGLLLAASLSFGALASAHNGVQTGNATASEVLEHVTSASNPGYLQLSYDDTLHLEFSDAKTADVSPRLQAVGFKQSLSEAGFQAVHARASLSETANYYWNALSGLGFAGTLEASSAEAVNYTFSREGRTIEAAFAQRGDVVVATLSWAPTTLAASN